MRGWSMLFSHLLAPVRGVGEVLAFAVHDEIQHFEGHPSQKIGDALGDLDHVKVLLPPHQFELDRLVFEADRPAIGGPRTNRVHPLCQQPASR